MRSFVLAGAVLLCGLSLAPACDPAPPPIPAPHPEGKDLVKGAIVAAAESSGGIRLYKVVHVDDYPPPIGWELHLIAYDPKVKTFEEAAALRKSGGTKVALDHVNVQLVSFLPRDHRVLSIEPVTDEELKPYIKSRDSRR